MLSADLTAEGCYFAMQQQELIPHLFRTEFSRITAVLCKQFGMEHMALAEDIASETFLTAVETWSYKGLPENPVAWLYTVAKNKARNHFARTATFNGKIAPELAETSSGQAEIEIDLSEQNITDSQLKLLFVLCHSSIPPESQIGLSLRILCGFGIDEIADAFLTNRETINKRLVRAREKLRRENVPVDLPPPAEIAKRLETVLTTLYLLFNEGYYSSSKDTVLRKDLCLEAMRLTYLLAENEQTDLPAVNALLALMCFHASRFEARENEAGEMILYGDQDESRWNRELIAQGGYFFLKASKEKQITKFHLEAGIAYWHTIKEDTTEKWEHILQFYNRLLQLEYSPIAALNRTYALSKANGKAEAIIEAEKLQLTGNHFYYTLLGELYKGIDDVKAKQHFEQALKLARTKADKQVLQKQLSMIKDQLSR
jgi:RNA polymerase sigma-70 factor (ECF subfamily)